MTFRSAAFGLVLHQHDRRSSRFHRLNTITKANSPTRKNASSSLIVDTALNVSSTWQLHISSRLPTCPVPTTSLPEHRLLVARATLWVCITRSVKRLAKEVLVSFLKVSAITTCFRRLLQTADLLYLAIMCVDWTLSFAKTRYKPLELSNRGHQVCACCCLHMTTVRFANSEMGVVL